MRARRGGRVCGEYEYQNYPNLGAVFDLTRSATLFKFAIANCFLNLCNPYAIGNFCKN
jgi:hypothetical protein